MLHGITPNLLAQARHIVTEVSQNRSGQTRANQLFNFISEVERAVKKFDAGVKLDPLALDEAIGVRDAVKLTNFDGTIHQKSAPNGAQQGVYRVELLFKGIDPPQVATTIEGTKNQVCLALEAFTYMKASGTRPPETEETDNLLAHER